MLSKASNSSANSPGDLNLLQRTGLCRDNSCIIFSGKTRASAHMYLEEKCSTNCWPEGFWNAWVNPTMVRYMTYVIYIYIFIHYIYTGIIQQCPVVLILNPKVRNFLEWIRNFSSWMELWWQAAAWDCLGLVERWIYFPGCKWPPRKTLYTFLVRKSHT